MTLRLRELERVERRVLGALRCVDASTGAPIERPLHVQAAGVRLLRNASGLVVIDGPALLPEHAAAFAAPPAAPALASIALLVEVDDPAAEYLPRRATVRLPRDPDPANAGNADSLFRPVELPLYPAPAARTGSNWSLLRVSVREAASGDALGGALLLVSVGAVVRARGLSDWRGEALVAVPGVPVTTWSDDPDAVVVDTLAVTVRAVFDPAPDAGGTRVAAADVAAGRAPDVPPRTDPDSLEAGQATLPRAEQPALLRAARSQALTFAIAVP